MSIEYLDRDCNEKIDDMAKKLKDPGDLKFIQLTQPPIMVVLFMAKDRSIGRLITKNGPSWPKVVEFCEHKETAS